MRAGEGQDDGDQNSTARQLEASSSGTTKDVGREAEERWLVPKEPEDPRNECILLFGAFCNGNMGDVIQANAVERLLGSVAPGQCFWYGHPMKEVGGVSESFGAGRFFGRNASRVIPLDDTSASVVNHFKAMVIGGGGVFVSPHMPLTSSEFQEEVKIPLVVLGVGADYHAKKSATLLEKAVYVSGRDIVSRRSLASVLRKSANPVVDAEEVDVVRDPVLSCKHFSDTEGKCWKQSEGSEQPLCFVLPASTTEALSVMHQHLVQHLVRPEDVFINVFPKHQEAVEAHGYPGDVEEVLDPEIYAERLCSCRAIISSRLHGAILGLHMGVPTFGAWYLEPEREHKVVDLMVRVMELPDQYIYVHENLTRVELEDQVDKVVENYHEGDRRAEIHTALQRFDHEFEDKALHILGDILGIKAMKPVAQASEVETGQSLGIAPQRESETMFGIAKFIGGLETSLVLVVLIVMMARRRRKREPAVASAVRSTGRASYSNDEAKAKQHPSSRVLISKAIDRTSEHGGAAVPRFLLAVDFFIWVILAVGFSVYGKRYLHTTRDPAGLLALQGVVGVAILASLGFNRLIDLDPIRELQNAAQGRAGGVGLLHATQALMTNIAVMVGGVAMTNAVKAMEPAAAAVLSYFILGKRSSGCKIVAVVMIMMGITILTWKSGRTSGSFSDSSSAVMASSLVTISAVSLNALRNVVLKMGQPVPSHVTLYVCSAMAAIVGLSGSLPNLIVRQFQLEEAEQARPFQMSGLNAALCFVGYNFASFHILNHLSPVGHAVGNACKRIVVFASGLLMLGEVMTSQQYTGAFVALTGVVGYNLLSARSC